VSKLHVFLPIFFITVGLILFELNFILSFNKKVDGGILSN
jgi:hypothetical protein